MDPLGIGIGGTQILVVLIVAFFVLGPERLPEVARQIARGVRTLRGYAADVQGQFEGEFGELREQFGDIQRDLNTSQQSLRSGLADLDSSLRSVHGEINSTVSGSIVSFEAARDARLNGSEPPVSPESLTAAQPASGAPATFDYAPERPAARPSVTAPPPPAGLSAPAASEGARLPEYRPPA